jgi:hypothetical protein
MSPNSSIARAVLAGGAVAGTLDIVYACTRNAGFGKPGVWTLQSVASGWLGEAAFQGGMPAAMLGLASHYGIMLVIAAVYVLAGTRLAALRTHALACGALYGIAVYLFMNFVVIRLSAFPYDLSYPLSRLLEGFVSHTVLIGIPIALAARWLAAAAAPAAPVASAGRP